ncbi:MAG: tetratricopeptide repeat protein [Deltaproteobacteria bacterium]|nr:tetratricopeptide repeat protein [Deltaproteobacteria bacterium]
MASNKTVKNRAVTVHLLLLVSFTFLIYSNALDAPFIFDDYANIIRNPRLKDLSDFWPPSGTRYLSYLSFALNYQISGAAPFGYHLFNMVIHTANAALVYFLALHTFETPLLKATPGNANPGHIALFSALLFTAHPVQTEAVTYISQRFTSLAVFFYLFSLVCFIRWRLSDKKILSGFYLLSVLSAISAQVTKEISFTLPFIIFIYDLIFFKGHVRAKRYSYTIPLLAPLFIIPFMLFFPEMGSGISEEIRGSQIHELLNLSRHDYLINQFRVIVTYIRLLALPVNQNLDYDWALAGSFFEPEVIISFVFLLAVFSFAVYFLIRFYKNGNGPLALASFGVVWFFITLSIESSVIPIKDVIFEHRLYLPSVGIAAAFSSALFYGSDRLNIPFRKTGIVLLLIVAALGGATLSRNEVWADKIAFWKDIAEKSPDKARAHINLGFAYREEGLLDEALDEYRKALTIEPQNPVLLNNIGVAHLMLGNIDEAIKAIKSSIQARPDYPESHNSLGYAYFTKGRIDEAIVEYNEALKLKPGYTEAEKNLETALRKKRGDAEKRD